MRLKLVHTIFLLLSTLHMVHGQNSHFCTALQRANAYYDNGEFASAIPYYRKGIAKQPSAFAFYRLAESFMFVKNYEAAEQYLRQMQKKGYRNDSMYVLFSEVLMSLEKYDEALYALENVETKTSITRRIERSVDSAMYWIGNPKDIRIRNVKELNTSNSEIGPARFKKGLVFSSNREGVYIKEKSHANNLPFFRLYTSEKVKGEWSVPVNLFSLTFDEIHQGKAVFNNTFDEIFFTRSNFETKDTNVVGLSIYKSEKDSAGWSTPKILNFNPGTAINCHPSISFDGNIFVFASNKSGGYGGMDLYISIRIDSVWTKPMNLGPSINTTGDEIYPYIQDSVTLYFSSNGHIGMGGFDNYRVSLDNGDWSVPINLGYPLNSSRDDTSIYFDTPTTGYFSSNRLGGKGREDIYWFGN